MTCRAAPFLSAILALGLVLGAFAQGHAQARAPATEIHEVTICSETGLEIIHLDANGQPINPDDCRNGLCQDCLRIAAQLPIGVSPVAPETPASRSSDPAVAALPMPDMTRAANQPRAPPIPIQA